MLSLLGLAERGDRRASNRSFGVEGRSVPGGRAKSCAELGESGDWKASRRYNLELGCKGSCGCCRRGEGFAALRRFANVSDVELAVGEVLEEEVEVCSLRARMVSARVEFE
jgi:hypothetical protein